MVVALVPLMLFRVVYVVLSCEIQATNCKSDTLRMKLRSNDSRTYLRLTSCRVGRERVVEPDLLARRLPAKGNFAPRVRYLAAVLCDRRLRTVVERKIRPVRIVLKIKVRRHYMTRGRKTYQNSEGGEVLPLHRRVALGARLDEWRQQSPCHALSDARDEVILQ